MYLDVAHQYTAGTLLATALPGSSLAAANYLKKPATEAKSSVVWVVHRPQVVNTDFPDSKRQYQQANNMIWFEFDTKLSNFQLGQRQELEQQFLSNFQPEPNKLQRRRQST